MISAFKFPVAYNLYALVDEADAAMVKRYKWYVVDEGYGKVYIYGRRLGFNKVRRVNLARLIAGARGGQVVGFKNSNPLDCRKENLQLVDRRRYIGSVMQRRSITRAGKLSKYRGVTRKKGPVGAATRWRAYIRVSGRFIYLGHYKTEKEAARAYDIAALKHFGPEAKRNFPSGHGA